MTTAPTYNRVFSFTSYQAVNPTDPLPANQIDAELNAIKITLDAMLQNTALIQRTDGALANASVGPQQLAPSLTLGITYRGIWTVGIQYFTGDAVFYGSSYYICLATNTSGAVTPDNDPGNWQFATDLGAVGANLAALPTYSGSGPAPVPTGQLFWNNGILTKAQ